MDKEKLGSSSKVLYSSGLLKIRPIIIYLLYIYLSFFCVHVLISELLDIEGSSVDESTTNSLHFLPTVAFATLYV